MFSDFRERLSVNTGYAISDARCALLVVAFVGVSARASFAFRDDRGACRMSSLGLATCRLRVFLCSRELSLYSFVFANASFDSANHYGFWTLQG